LPDEGSTTFPTLPPFSKKREREGRTIKDGEDSDQPRAYEAQGLDRRKLNLERKKTKHAKHSSIKRTKDLRGVKTLHRGLKKEREGRTIKDGQDSDRPRAREARGLDRKRLKLKQKRTKHVTMQEHSLI
jgi:hypothetical protein